jgi:diguanylate cyclase (GGDEF)-like protein
MKKNKEFHGIILDMTILLLLVFITTLICCYTTRIDELYDFLYYERQKKYLEILVIFALTSFYLGIFILRRFLELRSVIKKANTDVLLNVSNRRRGIDLMTNVINKSAYASMIMFDIDDFKKINDLYGHNQGDHVLQEIVRLIKVFGRKEDELIRWGGDEFILLCYNTTQKDALGLAQRLRENIEKHTFATKFKVTASFGVSELNPNEELRVQIDRLDRNMYKSKEEGKNKVTAKVA